MNPPASAARIARSLRRRPVRRTGVRRRLRLEEIAEPDLTYPEPPHTWREIPRGETDPARAAWIETLLRDPAAAKRAQAEGRLAYWQRRVEALAARLGVAERELIAAAADPATPPAERFEARVRRIVALTDLNEARARLREAEEALAQ